MSGEDQKEKTRFGLKKEISVGDIILTATLVIGLVIGWNNLTNRVERLELRVEYQEKGSQDQDKRIEKLQSLINDKLQRLNEKMDRFFDRFVHVNGQ